MEQEGFVSLWVGEFTSKEKFEDYFYIEYTDDGDANPSNFEEDFSIEYYDEDFREVVFFQQPVSNPNELLKGFSYDETLIPKFHDMLVKNAPDSVNAVVLLYNFKYHPIAVDNKASINRLQYIGAVLYK
jgi:Immunity protein 22